VEYVKETDNRVALALLWIVAIVSNVMLELPLVSILPSLAQLLLTHVYSQAATPRMELVDSLRLIVMIIMPVLLIPATTMLAVYIHKFLVMITTLVLWILVTQLLDANTYQSLIAFNALELNAMLPTNVFTTSATLSMVPKLALLSTPPAVMEMLVPLMFA
jgi:hypothetical protein